MSMTTVFVTLLVVVVIVFKFNHMQNKGIMNFLVTKIIVLSVVATLLGVYSLFNPDFQIQEMKEVLTSYMSSVIQ